MFISTTFSMIVTSTGLSLS
ncbi:hypothetical protein HU200_026547 [Digitaria exilis]|uniref:Uncharacterized protein n=1 Tax=Digitaria exilis TaxID=1010633 RepID=A0A835C787_9POAL|nr:hypothetical protein HU200_026547 [Digitaria exilis]